MDLCKVCDVWPSTDGRIRWFHRLQGQTKRPFLEEELLSKIQGAGEARLEDPAYITG